MEDFDDGDGWCARALRDPALAADVLVSLCHASWRHLPDPVVSPPTPAVWEERLPAWGSRRRRSRTTASPAMRGSKEDDVAPRSAADRMRASPMTPLDFGAGSGSSESGGSGFEESPPATKRSRTGEPAGGRERKVVVAWERPPTVFSIPEAKPSRRPTKRKVRTISELQAMERSLLDEREMLQKELEAQMSVHAELVAENQRLKRRKLNLESKSMHEQVQQKQLRPHLPDLNIPLSEELDQQI